MGEKTLMVPFYIFFMIFSLKYLVQLTRNLILITYYQKTKKKKKTKNKKEDKKKKNDTAMERTIQIVFNQKKKILDLGL